MNNEKTKGFVRHILTLIGGILIALGFLTADAAELLTTAVLEVVGGIMVIWGFIASWLNKDKKIPDGDS
jgi:uncharacterized membrane protein YphA (DoxX/SURF4 family)